MERKDVRGLQDLEHQGVEQQINKGALGGTERKNLSLIKTYGLII